jgi:crossover junction endodeoxyribonuclease RuvC
MKMKLPEKIVGLDLSLTSTGIVTYAMSSAVECNKVVKTTNKYDYMTRYNKILAEIEIEIAETEAIFFIEGYALGSFSKSTAMSNLMELGGIIKFYLWENGVDFIVVPPTSLKKFVTGKGNSKKEDVKLGIYKRYGREFVTSDEADAFGLMAFGYAYFMGKLLTGKELTITEKDCITKIRGEKNDA